MKEKDIVKKIRDHLKTKYNVSCVKYHGGPFAQAGVSDLICVLPPLGRAVYLEVKQPGKRPTEIQTAFLEDVTGRGALGGVVTSVKDVDDLLLTTYK